MLHFNVIVRQVMVLSLERIIWYNFNSFLHVEIFVDEPFFSTKKLLDERWEEVLPPQEIGRDLPSSPPLPLPQEMGGEWPLPSFFSCTHTYNYLFAPSFHLFGF
jgi:hypothetical protein